MSKPLPKELTSYDLLKTFAVVFMVVDHVGFYFFPDDNWWRVAGRLCVPVWFFLIGYANSRDLSPRLWAGAVILICSDILAGLYFFPLNILASMLIIRLSIDGLMQRALRSVSHFWAVITMLFLLAIPSGMVFEYGTLGFILAIFGYLLRRRDELKLKYKELLNHYFAFSAVAFIGLQSVLFGFETPQPMALTAGIMVVMGALYMFKPVTLPKLTEKMPRPFTWLLQLAGRRTMEIYVAHLLLFKILGVIYQPERFALLDWDLFYMGEDI